VANLFNHRPNSCWLCGSPGSSLHFIPRTQEDHAVSGRLLSIQAKSREQFVDQHSQHFCPDRRSGQPRAHLSCVHQHRWPHFFGGIRGDFGAEPTRAGFAAQTHSRAEWSCRTQGRRVSPRGTIGPAGSPNPQYLDRLPLEPQSAAVAIHAPRRRNEELIQVSR
jgi:hypothetical protein